MDEIRDLRQDRAGEELMPRHDSGAWNRTLLC